MLQEILTSRGVPALLSRAEMLDILQREEYGYLPEKPDRMEWKVRENCIPSFCAGKVTAQRVELTVYIGETPFTFPFIAVVPKGKGPYPFFIHINFRPDVPDRYMPTEEITDNGFGVLSFCYNDVTSDNGDFTNGLAGVLYPDGKRNPTDPGKIALWAWAAQRVLDYAEQEPRLDMSRAMVCGHSRLGKTALLCGATDERFYLAHSNNSGCSGAAVTREKVGERVEQITRNFPYWFCENYKKYIGKEFDMPFDQHFLIASIAPAVSTWPPPWRIRGRIPPLSCFPAWPPPPPMKRTALRGWSARTGYPKRATSTMGEASATTSAKDCTTSGGRTGTG